MKFSDAYRIAGNGQVHNSNSFLCHLELLTLSPRGPAPNYTRHDILLCFPSAPAVHKNSSDGRGTGTDMLPLAQFVLRVGTTGVITVMRHVVPCSLADTRLHCIMHFVDHNRFTVS
jgi:hypothetical protein